MTHPNIMNNNNGVANSNMIANSNMMNNPNMMANANILNKNNAMNNHNLITNNNIITNNNMVANNNLMANHNMMANNNALAGHNMISNATMIGNANNNPLASLDMSKLYYPPSAENKITTTATAKKTRVTAEKTGYYHNVLSDGTNSTKKSYPCPYDGCPKVYTKSSHLKVFVVFIGSRENPHGRETLYVYLARMHLEICKIR